MAWTRVMVWGAHWLSSPIIPSGPADPGKSLQVSGGDSALGLVIQQGVRWVPLEMGLLPSLGGGEALLRSGMRGGHGAGPTGPGGPPFLKCTSRGSRGVRALVH